MNWVGYVGGADEAGHVAMQTDEIVRWSGYPSWAHFTWLYCFSLVAAGRTLLALWWGMSGWEIWLGGATTLLLCVVLLRRWAQYCITSRDRNERVYG